VVAKTLISKNLKWKSPGDPGLFHANRAGPAANMAHCNCVEIVMLVKLDIVVAGLLVVGLNGHH